MVAILRSLHTADRDTTDPTSSRRRTRSSSSGGRAVSPNTAGRFMAGDTKVRH